MRSFEFAPAAVEAERRSDGGWLLRSPYPLPAHEASLGARLEYWAKKTPHRTFVAERDAANSWRHVTYGQALVAIRSLAQALLDLGLDRTKPLAILSDNSIDHALLMLAAMHVGIPAAPISAAYSLVSRDHAKLGIVAQQIAPGAMYASNATTFAAAFDAIDAALGRVLPRVVSTFGDAGAENAKGAVTVELLRSTDPSAAVERAFRDVGPDTIAKVLLTSGSTGTPKGMVNTQRMLCSNQAAITETWRFLRDEAEPPVILDWLPWSHTFGGNHNFNMMLWNGGTLYIDGGKPAPALVPITVANLREIAPTMYFNVPRGFDAILPYFEAEPALAERFFSRLGLVFYAAAALPQSTWERLERVAAPWQKEGGRRLAMTSAWGSTETSPLALQVHFPIPRAGVIGLPPAGMSLALVPGEARDKMEMRVKGPNVTPGTWQAGGGITPVHLDSEGFLPTGDAGKLEDEAEPARGVVFDGRIAENFKLTSGTWVAVGALRIALVGACAPLVLDAVITGHDRDDIGALLFADPSALTRLSLTKEALRSRIAEILRTRNVVASASSTRIARALILDEPLSLDAGEITDKGYVNQRAVLTRRADDVVRLYEATLDAPDAAVIVLA